MEDSAIKVNIKKFFFSYIDSDLWEKIKGLLFCLNADYGGTGSWLIFFSF